MPKSTNNEWELKCKLYQWRLDWYLAILRLKGGA